MRSLSSRLVPVLLALALLGGTASEASAQCAMCRENVMAAKEEGSGLADGIHYSILFMLGLPLAVGGGFAFALWNASRKARRVQ